MDFFKGLYPKFTNKYDESFAKQTDKTNIKETEVKSAKLKDKYLSSPIVENNDFKNKCITTDELKRQFEEYNSAITFNNKKIEESEEEISILEKDLDQLKDDDDLCHMYSEKIQMLNNMVFQFKEMNSILTKHVFNVEDELINKINAVIIGDFINKNIKFDSGNKEENIELPKERIANQLKSKISALRMEITKRKESAVLLDKFVNWIKSESIDLLDKIRFETDQKLQKSIEIQEKFNANIFDLEERLKQLIYQYKELNK